MKTRFNFNLICILGLFALAAPSAFPGGGGRVGNGKKADDAKGATDSSLTATPTPSDTPTPAPTPKPKPKS